MSLFLISQNYKCYVTYFSQQEEKLSYNNKNRNVLHMEFISIDKSIDNSHDS